MNSKDAYKILINRGPIFEKNWHIFDIYWVKFEIYCPYFNH